LKVVAQQGASAVLVAQGDDPLARAVSVDFMPAGWIVRQVGTPLPVGSYLARGYWTLPTEVSAEQAAAALAAAEPALKASS
jgi:hypothetical protein